MNKKFSLDKLVRGNIKKLQPYHSARQDFSEGLLLDANENSLNAPYPEAEGLHRYPSPQQTELRSRIAEWRRVRRENVFVGVGSDESIDLLYRIFCDPGKDRVMITPPTYGMYKVSANIHNVAVDSVLLQKVGFQPDAGKILNSIKPDTKLLFLCSPNNPTGNTLDRSVVEQLIRNFSGIVVVDEAYVDFSEEKSWAAEVVNYPNLVVLQTLSKSFGLAGIRLGIAIAQQDIIEYFLKIKAPYNVNALTSKYGVEAFNHLNDIQFKIDAIKKERERLREQLENLACVEHIYPSDANFLLVRFNEAVSLYKKLADDGIIVRYRGNEAHCENCLRITVGTPDENDQLIKAIKHITS